MRTSLKFPQNAIFGAIPGDPFAGVNAVDGDAEPWVAAPVGHEYWRKNTTSNYIQPFIKREARSADNAWGVRGGVHVIQQTVLFSDFTDGGATVGTLVLNEAIPEGAFVLRVLLDDVTGFTGDTSATLMIGDGTDDDRYNASADVDVFTTATVLDAGAPQGIQVHVLAKSITLTITSTANFTAVAAGQMTVKVFYLY